MLLKEVEISRGTVVQSDLENIPVDPDQSSSACLDISQFPDSSTMNSSGVKRLLSGIDSTASAVIGEHLVSWRNLEEVQVQNQKLLCVARDLASQLEKYEEEESETAKRIANLSARLETLSGELEVVKLVAREARTQEQVVTRQKNLYRSLLRRHDIKVAEELDSRASLVSDDSMQQESISADKSTGTSLTFAFVCVTCF